jgi:asparagine synthase (glutamine-hydrolysing)
MHGMRHHIAAYDDPKLFSDPDAFTRAEPLEDPLAGDFLNIARDAAKRSRTLLTGIGGDVVFYTSHRHFLGLLARGRFDTLIAEVVSYRRRTGKRPPLNLRAPLKRLFGAKPWRAPFPRWIRDDVARRYELRERFHRELPLPELHPLRPEAHRSLVHPYWPRFCETWDAGETGLALDVAYPMFDRRLVELLFAFPPMPWFANKYLLREGMRGRLPDDVRERPKTPLDGNPMAIAYAASHDALRKLRASQEQRFIDIDRLMSDLNGSGGVDSYAPHALALLHWWQFRDGAMRL